MDTIHITIAVGLSGGVDSAVSAALLKEQGYQVVGFFMKNWGNTVGLKIADCPWMQDRQDALSVAAKLNIPFHTLDFEEQYKNHVLDYFFKEYEAGRTPNPDVMCNSKIKFGVFLDTAMALGADYVATGHYARLRREAPITNLQSPENNQSQIPQSEPVSRVILSKADQREAESTCPQLLPACNTVVTALKQCCRREDLVGSADDGVQLLKGIDTNKDQSYFLYRLNQNQLSKAVFPIGEYTKPQVRELAKKFNLPNQAKRDSQGVCFVGHIDLQKFLSQKIKPQPGDIVSADGKKLGMHTGLFWYTLGQRKGINIGGTGPYYVLRKDFERNELVVVNDANDAGLYMSSAIIGDAHWISGEEPDAGKTYSGRVRYREALSKARITKSNPEQYCVDFETPQWAVSSGQSVVLYDGDVCVGGGIVG